MVQQGRVVQGHLAGEKSSGLTESQRLQIQQYEKIVRFQESLLSGNHPSIKLPPHLIASAQSSKHALDVRAKSGATARHLDNALSFSTNARQPILPVSSAQTVSAAPAAKSLATGKPEINPILLEKSDDLIRAEIQLKRQRLERALREEVEQRRVTTKNVAQGEPLADFDLSEVLSKALTLVQATTAPCPAGENVGVTNHESSSDSFDENTFYSSHHHTPESVLISRVRNESEDVRMPDTREPQQLASEQNGPPKPDHPAQPVPEANASQPRQNYPEPAPNLTSYAVDSRPRAGQVPGLTSRVDARVISSGPSQATSAVQSQSGDSGNLDTDQQERSYRTDSRQRPSDPYVDRHPPSPLIQSRDSLHALPSAHTPPLMPMRSAVVVEQISSSSTGTPAQVAVLRNEPAVGTSPEGSSQGGRQPERKKGKKKKRKADRQAPEAEATYIKPEPQSPSPMHTPSYIRPNKRQKQSQRHANEPAYGDARYNPQSASALHEVYSGHLPRDDRIPVTYERTGMYPQRAVSAAIAGPTYGRDYGDERYVSGGPYLVAPSPSHPDPHSRPIGSQIVPTEGYPGSTWSYLGGYEPPPISIQRENETFIQPPRPPQARIIVDAFGREYIEPPRPAVIRHSVGPPIRRDEPEIIYERTAPRAASRHAPIDSYGQGGAVYRRTSPSYMPRRVVTQPEYVSQEYRNSRPREYSSRPMAASNDYTEVMVPPERRHVEERPRECIQRAASVRPAEPVRYEVSRDYGRVQSVRPEAPILQYAPGAHTESHREPGPSYIREYGTRPVETTVMRRDYAARPPVERYYDQPVRGGEDIAFIEQPGGATQEIVYADDARREHYR
ncbi:hypothetical protein BGZ63DRAFT_402619 [Mariannaea sp. PMI_226]|nr:hypothetical protein BGZ63DRAFT_402619 [Mariannaea sp. PMI_226]